MHIFERLVTLCLGPGSVSAKKLECGNPLVILGLNVHLTASGITFWPEASKVSRNPNKEALLAFIHVATMHRSGSGQIAFSMQSQQVC